MGDVDELVRARAEFERGEWAGALERWSSLDTLGGADLVPAAGAAHLLGRLGQSAELYRRAHEDLLAAGDLAAAVRCTFELSMLAGTTGDLSAAAGWVARGERLLAELPAGSLEAGYVSFARMFGHLRAGELDEATTCALAATDAGRRHRDPALVALGLCSQGRLAIYGGRVRDGLGLLDESMVEAGVGAPDAVLVGHVYCTAIEGCQEVSDLDRVAEWTAVLQRWCAARPQLVIFIGQCSLHRAQVLRARGAWSEAIDELGAAIERYDRAGTVAAVGQASYERGELLRLRGDLEEAEHAYGLAAERGVDPQPGLAELWLARGADAAAAGAVRRVLEETAGPVARGRVLPGVLRVALATGDLDGARSASRELEGIAADFASASLEAEAALGAAAVLREGGDPLGALPYLRKAVQLAARLDLPHVAARARADTGRALLATGDAGSAERELSAARALLEGLGARPEAAVVTGLLAPASRPAGLTEREVEVLRLVAAGRSNAEVASALVLSERTVARHLSNIFAKLDVASRTAAAAFAYEHDLVRP